LSHPFVFLLLLFGACRNDTSFWGPKAITISDKYLRQKLANTNSRTRLLSLRSFFFRNGRYDLPTLRAYGILPKTVVEAVYSHVCEEKSQLQ